MSNSDNKIDEHKIAIVHNSEILILQFIKYLIPTCIWKNK